MKLVTAVIQPERLESVKAALAEIEVFRMTVVDAKGFGRSKMQHESYRGHEVSLNLTRKLLITIAINDIFLEPTIAALKNAAKTGAGGHLGDGILFVQPLDDCIRIRTGEHGGEAI